MGGILSQIDELHFDKFKCSFEAGFPLYTLKKKLIIDIDTTEKTWQYLNSKNIKLNYTIFINERTNILFLTNYIKFHKLHRIEDCSLSQKCFSVAMSSRFRTSFRKCLFS